MPKITSKIFYFIPCLALIPFNKASTSFDITIKNPYDFEIEIHSNAIKTDSLPGNNYFFLKGYVNEPFIATFWATKVEDNKPLGEGKALFNAKTGKRFIWIAGKGAVEEAGESSYNQPSFQFPFQFR